MSLRSKITALFRKEKLDAEMAEEMRAHLELETQQNLSRGMSSEEARYAARRAFGGDEQIKEQCRDERGRGLAWIDHLARDVRYAMRTLRKAPGFAATAILTAALGIGACTVLFSVVNGVLFRPLPFPEPERIVALYETQPPESRSILLAPANSRDWAAQSSAFAYFAVRANRSFTTLLDQRATIIEGFAVTADFFRVLGVEPILGRGLSTEDESPGRNQVAVLSHRLWQERFGGRRDILDTTLLLNDRPHLIVGVLPEGNLPWDASIFTPLAFSVAEKSDRSSHGFAGIGRLRAGVTLATAQAELDVISARLAQSHPDTNAGRGARVTSLRTDLTGDVRLPLLVLLGAVGFVLLIACLNLAGLLLARADTRRREIAVRAALGAPRGRIVHQFLAESFTIAIAGGGLGVLLAFASVSAVARFAGNHVPRADEITLDGPVLGVAFGLILLVGLASGLAPALQITRGDLARPLNETGRGNSGGRQRVRAGIVIAEIALAMVLLVGAGLLARSLMALQQTEQGFDARRVYLDRVWLRGRNYDSPQKVTAFVDAAIERIGSRPDVRAVAIANGLPIIGSPGLLYRIVGAPEVPAKDLPVTSDFAVTPGYFDALGIPLRRGRGFTSQDTAGAPRVAIVNQELVRRHFPDRDPIGQRIMIMTEDDQPDAEREIVGVVGDVRPDGPQSTIGPQVYEPLAQRAQAGLLNIVVKASGSAPALSAAIGDVVHALDPNLPFRNRHDFHALVAQSWSRQRFSTILFTLFSGAALSLAAIGIYGVIAYAVQQRTREIGVRMALGAQRADVFRLVLAQAGRLVVMGIASGTLGALLLTRYLASQLFGVGTRDFATFGAIAVLLASVALVAAFLPARRATRVDPMIALRAE